jgi:hypothetical protein
MSINTDQMASFRRLLPPKDWYKTRSLSSSTARQWYEDKKDVPALEHFLRKLEAQNVPSPFKGFTSDGNVVDGLFQYAPDEGAPTAMMVKSASKLLRSLSAKQRASTVFDSLEDDMFRIWSNPEFYVNEGKPFQFKTASESAINCHRRPQIGRMRRGNPNCRSRCASRLHVTCRLCKGSWLLHR